VKKVDYFLRWSAPLLGGIGLKSDALAPEIPAIDVPFAQWLGGIPFLCGVARGLDHGSNTLYKLRWQPLRGIPLLEAIWEEPAVIPRSRNGKGIVSPHADAGFVKLEAALFNMQNLENRPI
jgi:hypothetical protein